MSKTVSPEFIRQIDKWCDAADLEDDRRPDPAAGVATLDDQVERMNEYRRAAETVNFRQVEGDYAKSKFRSKSREMRGAKFGA